MKKIVVGTDFNELAAAALRFAAVLARRTGAEVIAVYADTFEPPVEFTAMQLYDITESIERSRAATREQLELHVAKHLADGVRWRAIVAEGLPATAICGIANTEKADLIVIGTHGRGGLERLLLGSVAEAVIREADVPVLTVHSTDVPTAVRRILAPAGTAEAAFDTARALGAELTVAEEARDSGEFDVIVAGADRKRARDVVRHSRTPILSVK